MLRHPAVWFRGGLCAAVAALALVPADLTGQEEDFLFKRPVMTLGVNLGWAAPREGGDVFGDGIREFFTVEKGDFSALAVSGDLAYRVTERFDVGLELGWTEGETQSEDREFIGTDDLPIVQTTRFARRPITANVKAYLYEGGRSISRFAWVPGRWSPWLGAGAGLMWYRLEQEGEFVDYETLEIFNDDYVLSEGTTGTFHVMGGADVTLAPRFLFTTQLRYSWASADPDPFVLEGFDEIDLAGFQATAGIKVRF